jgi:NTP pyrophosphatase (non-canonical NTP hydrolase)
VSAQTEPIWTAVPAACRWLDDANGTTQAELSSRILKLTEEAGEVAAAWIGVIGSNPRKGVTHTPQQVAEELADVALTALVAIQSLGFDARTQLNARAVTILGRLATDGPRPLS